MNAQDLNDPERLLALNYVPKHLRPSLSALWQLDEMLARIVSGTTEPMIGQMRLTWWYERLVALDNGDVPAEPLLRTLSDVVVSRDVTGSEMAELVEGWEALLDTLPLDVDALSVFANKRGGTLFTLSAKLLGAADVRAVGAGWALTDFAGRCSDRTTAERAIVMARDYFATSSATKPRSLRLLARVAAAKARRSTDKIGNPLGRFEFLRAMIG